MTDTAKPWIEERRAARVPNSTLSISDAHNNLPRALDALEAVLELHKPKYLIRDGEWFPASCAVCEPWTWPCATVQAIEGAIND